MWMVRQFSVFNLFRFSKKIAIDSKEEEENQNSHSKIQSLPKVVLDFKHVEWKKKNTNKCYIVMNFDFCTNFK